MELALYVFLRSIYCVSRILAAIDFHIMHVYSFLC